VKVKGTKLFVAELVAIDGTPTLDIKPVMKEFLPRDEVRQPSWSLELMRDYWLTDESCHSAWRPRTAAPGLSQTRTCSHENIRFLSQRIRHPKGTRPADIHDLYLLAVVEEEFVPGRPSKRPAPTRS
jgi:hypothetical protein